MVGDKLIEDEIFFILKNIRMNPNLCQFMFELLTLTLHNSEYLQD